MFVHPSVDGHLTCFHLLATVHSECCHPHGVQNLLETLLSALWGLYPEAGLRGHTVVLLLIFGLCQKCDS